MRGAAKSCQCTYCDVIHIKNRCNIMRMHIVNKECHNAVMLTWIL